MITLCSNNVFEKTSQQLHKTDDISEAKRQAESSLLSDHETGLPQYVNNKSHKNVSSRNCKKLREGELSQ